MSKYQFGEFSSKKLSTVEPSLELVMRGALATGLIDMVVLEGERSKEKQNEYYNNGKSKVQWPNGKHNTVKPEDKAKACDVAPYINGKASFNHKHCCFMAGIILGVSKSLGIKIRWGGNWDMDGEPITDQQFQDLVHFELF